MSVSDEDPYSTIFASLKHPIRRRILRMLSEKPSSFSEMLEALGVSSSFLTYHLENLGELLGKMDDGRYRLSSFGEAAMATMTKVEDIPTTIAKPKRVVARALNSHVSLKVPFVAVIVVLLLVSSVFTYYYLNSASELSDRNREVASLQSNLNELNQDLGNLKSNQTAFKALLSSLKLEASQLQNYSALLQLELSIVEQVGKLSISTYYVNDTMTVAPNSTVLLTSQVNGYNGTIVFISPNGCYSAGSESESVQPQYVLDFLLNSNSPLLTSAYTSLSGQPFSVSFKNIGSSPVQCTFSLFYVYQTTH